MNGVSLMRRLHKHRQWANRRLRDAAAELSQAKLCQQFSIGQGSVWQSLLHLYAAEYVWLAALQGDEDPLTPGDLPDMLPGNQQGQAAIQTFDQLSERWTELDRRWQDFLDNLNESDLETLTAKRSTSSGKGRVYRTSVADVLLHVCTHAQYTTAQTVNMLRQLGSESLPDTMLISYARQEIDATQSSEGRGEG